MPRHGWISACLLLVLKSNSLLYAFYAPSEVRRRRLDRCVRRRDGWRCPAARRTRDVLVLASPSQPQMRPTAEVHAGALPRSLNARRLDGGASPREASFTSRVSRTDTVSAAWTTPLSRRHIVSLAIAAQFAAAAAPVRAAATSGPSPSQPASAPGGQIQESIDALQSLVDEWSTAVVDCTFADVPRELLETKNKAELLEKAKTSALFDKSASVVSCKTSNRIVRDYLGSTGKGPLVALDKALRRGLDQLNGDSVEEYLQLVEEVQSDLSRADSLSYAAGVSDLSAINNFDRGGEAAALASNSSLREAKGAIESAISGLNRVVGLLTAS